MPHSNMLRSQFCWRHLCTDVGCVLVSIWIPERYLCHSMNLNFCPQIMSWMASLSMWILCSRSSIEWAVSGKRWRNILPAGMTLQTKANLPISDNNCLLVQVCWVRASMWNVSSSRWRAESLSLGSLASPAIVSSTTPSTGRVVEGPRIFSGMDCLAV